MFVCFFNRQVITDKTEAALFPPQFHSPPSQRHYRHEFGVVLPDHPCFSIFTTCICMNNIYSRGLVLSLGILVLFKKLSNGYNRIHNLIFLFHSAFLKMSSYEVFSRALARVDLGV